MRTYLPLFIALALFVALALPRIGTTLGQDEISHYYMLPRVIFENGYSKPDSLVAFSPHAYPLFVVAVCRILGNDSVYAIRIAGVLLWMLCLICVYLESHRSPWVVFLSVVPAVLQASMIVEIDQTILPLACLLQCIAFKHLQEKTDWRHFAFASMSMAFALWCRLTTPVLLMIPIIICAAFSGELRRRRVLFACASIACGCAVFFATWLGYCRITGVDWQWPFRYLLESFNDTTVGHRSSGLSRIVQSLAYLTLWGMLPAIWIVFLFDGWKRLKAFWKERVLLPQDIYWLGAFCILFGYMVIGGSLFGFPKYQMPAFPLLMLAVILKPKGGLKMPLAQYLGIAVFFAMLPLVCPDPIYLIRVVLKQFVLNGIPPMRIAILIAMEMALLLLSTCLMFKCRNVRHALLVSAFAFNFAFAVKQNVAPYSTGYIYGEAGECAEIAEYISRGNKSAFVPAEIATLVNQNDYQGFAPSNWDDLDALAARIRTEKPDIIACSLLINTMAQLKAINEHEPLVAELRSEYKCNKWGNVMVWERCEDR